MKPILFLLILCASFNSPAQIKLPINYQRLADFDFESLLNDHFDTSTHLRLRQQIRDLSQINDRDSIQKAATLIRKLYTRMPDVYKIDDFESELEQINEIKRKGLQNIMGAWKSIGVVDVWSREAYNPNKILLFTGSMIYIYLNENLIRATAYQLEIEKQKGRIWDNCYIVLLDSKEKWVIDIYSNKTTDLGGTSEEKRFLYFNRSPGCVCGCPIERYVACASEPPLH